MLLFCHAFFLCASNHRRPQNTLCHCTYMSIDIYLASLHNTNHSAYFTRYPFVVPQALSAHKTAVFCRKNNYTNSHQSVTPLLRVFCIPFMLPSHTPLPPNIPTSTAFITSQWHHSALSRPFSSFHYHRSFFPATPSHNVSQRQLCLYLLRFFIL